MNEKEIIKYFMMKIMEKTEDGINELNRPLHSENKMDLKLIRVCLKDVNYYARMIIEKDGAE